MDKMLSIGPFLWKTKSNIFWISVTNIHTFILFRLYKTQLLLLAAVVFRRNEKEAIWFGDHMKNVWWARSKVARRNLTWMDIAKSNWRIVWRSMDPRCVLQLLSFYKDMKFDLESLLEEEDRWEDLWMNHQKSPNQISLWRYVFWKYEYWDIVWRSKIKKDTLEKNLLWSGRSEVDISIYKNKISERTAYNNFWTLRRRLARRLGLRASRTRSALRHIDPRPMARVNVVQKGG